MKQPKEDAVAVAAAIERRVREILKDWTDVGVMQHAQYWLIFGRHKGKFHCGVPKDPIEGAMRLHQIATYVPPARLVAEASLAAPVVPPKPDPAVALERMERRLQDVERKHRAAMVELRNQMEAEQKAALEAMAAIPPAPPPPPPPAPAEPEPSQPATPLATPVVGGELAPDPLARLLPPNLDLEAQKEWARKRWLHLNHLMVDNGKSLPKPTPPQIEEHTLLNNYKGWFN